MDNVDEFENTIWPLRFSHTFKATTLHSCGQYERQIYYPLWTSATDLSLWSLWTEDTQEM